jgi:hypothetical protein
MSRRGNITESLISRYQKVLLKRKNTFALTPAAILPSHHEDPAHQPKPARMTMKEMKYSTVTPIV